MGTEEQRCNGFAEEYEPKLSSLTTAPSVASNSQKVRPLSVCKAGEFQRGAVQLKHSCPRMLMNSNWKQILGGVPSGKVIISQFARDVLM